VKIAIPAKTDRGTKIMTLIQARAGIRVRMLLALVTIALGLIALAPAGALAAGNAAYTTFDPNIEDGGFTGGCVHGSEVNCNTYVSKSDVYVNGGPTGGNGLANGEYFFAVLAPGCQNGGFLDGANGNLSDTTPGTGGSGCSDNGTGLEGDAVANRTFSVEGGVISAYPGTHVTGSAKNGNEIISAFPFDDTPNPGGVYILAICPVGATSAAPCKFDAFKVKGSGVPPDCQQTNTCPGLSVVKDANPEFTREFNWSIEKTVDACQVTLAYPNGCQTTHSEKTLNYTVTVTKDKGTDSGWQVSGTITILNANESETATGVSVADVVRDPSKNEVGSCDVNGSGSSPYAVGSVAPEETLELPYVCTFTTKPTYNADYTNTATVEWEPESVHSATGSESFAVPFRFTTPTSIVHDSVSLSDLYTVLPSGSATLVGTLPSGTISSSQTYKYSYVVKVPHDCVKLENTASFTVTDNDSDADDTGSSSVTAKVCRTPANTGALTMGFWQNKNGQGIISGQAKTGTCLSATWLRQFHPFSDLSATSTCAQVATYVYNVIKAATCTSTTKTCNSMLKAQMLATALDVYFSDPAFGGNKIGAFNGLGSKQAPIGSVTIDLTQICQMIDGSSASTCSGSYENVSSAFGGATSMTVLGMLSYQNTADPLADGGASWYGQVKATQVLAKDAFDAINNGVAFSV
jgi:hypothetical protein